MKRRPMPFGFHQQQGHFMHMPQKLFQESLSVDVWWRDIITVAFFCQCPTCICNQPLSNALKLIFAFTYFPKHAGIWAGSKVTNIRYSRWEDLIQWRQYKQEGYSTVYIITFPLNQEVQWIELSSFLSVCDIKEQRGYKMAFFRLDLSFRE